MSTNGRCRQSTFDGCLRRPCRFFRCVQANGKHSTQLDGDAYASRTVSATCDQREHRLLRSTPPAACLQPAALAVPSDGLAPRRAVSRPHLFGAETNEVARRSARSLCGLDLTPGDGLTAAFSIASTCVPGVASTRVPGPFRLRALESASGQPLVASTPSIRIGPRENVGSCEPQGSVNSDAPWKSVHYSQERRPPHSCPAASQIFYAQQLALPTDTQLGSPFVSSSSVPSSVPVARTACRSLCAHGHSAPELASVSQFGCQFGSLRHSTRNRLRHSRLYACVASAGTAWVASGGIWPCAGGLLRFAAQVATHGPWLTLVVPGCLGQASCRRVI
jgi:hypothetical protein